MMITTRQQNPSKPAFSYVPMSNGLFQRKCACGNHAVAGSVCAECAITKTALQRKLAVGASNDPLEKEADRVADQVLATPTLYGAGNAPPRVQRFTGYSHARVDAMPVSVDQALARSGRPLEPALQQDMELRFGHDFSRVRVHTDSTAGLSARDVNAQAYTVGSNVVFGSGQFSPGSPQGRRLLAHELTHVVQQSAAAALPAGDPAPLPRLGRTYGVAPFVIQRRSIFEGLAGLFRGDDFSDADLLAYLDGIDRAQAIEDFTESDNKARAIVRKWQRGDSRFLLTLNRKILLIREMLSGFTGNDDEQAILVLLRGSTPAEFERILTTVGKGTLDSAFQGDEQDQLDALVISRRGTPAQGRSQPGASAQSADTETFSAETVVELQRRFTSNAESTNRLNCIEIIRDVAPRLYASDPQLADRVRSRLARLRGDTLTMPDLGGAMAELGLSSANRRIPFNNGNGFNQPTAMQASAWDTIMGMIGSTPGWHIFGLAVFDGYHSVTVLVDNRPDGPRLYWADQWRIDPGDDFHEEEGSASGFRRYEQAGFDQFLTEYTQSRWQKVFETKNKRYDATLHIWKFRSSLSGE